MDNNLDNTFISDNLDNTCNFCSKKFINKTNLIRHQTTTKNCLLLQGKNNTDIECQNCKKKLTLEYFKKHKMKCDLELSEKNKIIDTNEKYKLLLEKKEELERKLSNNKKQYNLVEKQNKELENKNKELEKDLNYYKDNNDKLRIELVESKATISILEKHNERLYVSSNNVRVKLEEKQEKTNSD
jgi:hypothetical protein